MTEHTSGPWQINHDDGKGHYLIGPRIGENVGMAFGKTDAKIMAAAPDLLTALEAAFIALQGLCEHSCFEDNAPEFNEGGEPYEACQQARAAIAKAKGD